MKLYFLLFIVCLMSAGALGLEYEVTAPHRAALGGQFVTSVAFTAAEGEVAVAYEFPPAIEVMHYRIEGAAETDKEVEGNTHKWTFDVAEGDEAKIIVDFQTTTEGTFDYYLYIITPPGEERREIHTIEVYDETKTSPVETVIEPPTTTHVIDMEEDETDMRLLLQVIAVLVAGYYVYSTYEQDKKEEEELAELDEQISGDGLDSDQQAEE